MISRGHCQPLLSCDSVKEALPKFASDLCISFVLFHVFSLQLNILKAFKCCFPFWGKSCPNLVVCAHCRGIVDTPLIHSKDLQPLVRRWLLDIPAGRLAQVTDLQAAVVYLASEASDYMTGHNLVIEGGQSLW